MTVSVDDVTTIGVIGAGTMGSGIAQVAAQSGFEVVLLDQAEEWLDRGLATITAGFDRLVSKGRMEAADRDAALSRIEGTTRFTYLSECDLVIEAVTEAIEVKADVLRQIADSTEPGTIIASNTSSISISALGAMVPNPERVVGMHFFNPVPVLGLVEVIRGMRTSDQTAEAVSEVARRLGKTPVAIADSPGFAVNRLLIPMINEAILCVDQGVASAEDIDAAMKLGASHPIGPLALADLIGLDVVLFIMEVLHRDFGEDKYRPAPLLRRMVAAGLLGRKSGQGFHSHA